MPGSFLDSNTLLYLTSQDLAKFRRAKELVAIGGVINVQVLNEITNVMRRKFAASWDEIDNLVTDLSELLQTMSVTPDINADGRRLAQIYGFAVDDSFIVAAALQAGCDTLWSEDMQHGLVVENQLRIANPFVG